MTPSRDYYLPGRQLVSQQDSAIIPQSEIPRSRFINRWTRKTTFDAGLLVPFFVDEILPGDQVNYRATTYVRMATPIFPMFDNQRVDTFFFYVPSRILWENWAKMFGEQDEPTSHLSYLVPNIIFAPPGDPFPVAGDIYDHMGIPTDDQLTGATLGINALPLRAYNRIWNDWFRDQNIMVKQQVNVDNGPDSPANYILMERAKSHDYFTSCLPWPQKGDAVSATLSGMAPITGI